MPLVALAAALFHIVYLYTPWRGVLIISRLLITHAATPFFTSARYTLTIVTLTYAMLFFIARCCLIFNIFTAIVPYAGCRRLPYACPALEPVMPAPLSLWWCRDVTAAAQRAFSAPDATAYDGARCTLRLEARYHHLYII